MRLTEKELKEELANMHRFYYERADIPANDYDMDDETLNKIYQFGKADGGCEACGALYLALFGGKEYTHLLAELGNPIGKALDGVEVIPVEYCDSEN